MDWLRGAQSNEVIRLIVGTSAAVLKRELELGDIVLLFVRRIRQGKFLPQAEVVRQGALELHGPRDRDN